MWFKSLVMTALICGSLGLGVTSLALAGPTYGSGNGNSLPQGWDYSENVDKMRNSTTYFAELESTNSVDLKFPYNGGSRLSVTLMQKKNGLFVLVGINKGQFAGALLNSTTISAKFDNGKVTDYSVESPSSRKTNVFFIQELDGQSAKFYKKLLKAKKLIIEVNLFDDGRRQFEFDIPALDQAKLKKQK